jgi:hypothetical protein
MPAVTAVSVCVVYQKWLAITGGHVASSPTMSVRRAELGITIARIRNPNVRSNSARAYDRPGRSWGIVVAKMIDECSVAAEIVVTVSMARSADRCTWPVRHRTHCPRYRTTAVGTNHVDGSARRRARKFWTLRASATFPMR